MNDREGLNETYNNNAKTRVSMTGNTEITELIAGFGRRIYPEKVRAGWGLEFVEFYFDLTIAN